MTTDAHPWVEIDPARFEALVAVAGRAPSVHNTQPWRFRLVEADTIELHLAKDQVLRHIDRVGREAVISCGAALHNLLLALRTKSLVGDVSYLPDPDRPLVLASVLARPAQPATVAEQRALSATYRRHTHRSGFTAPVSDPLLRQALSEAARQEGAEVIWVAEAARSGVLAVAHAAAAHERMTPDLMSETAARTNLDGEIRTGVPPWAAAPRRPPADMSQRLPDRFVSESRYATEETLAGTLAVLVTNGDSVADWLAAGRALQRVLLLAAENWAFAALATSALETSYYREAVRSLLDTADFPQLILELGHSDHTLSTGRLAVDQLRLA